VQDARDKITLEYTRPYLATTSATSLPLIVKNEPPSPLSLPPSLTYLNTKLMAPLPVLPPAWWESIPWG